MGRQKNTPKVEAPKHYCDDCAIGEWYAVHWNLDLHGQPLTKHCKYGGKGLLRGTPACSHYTK